jgi:hypothetical protein
LLYACLSGAGQRPWANHITSASTKSWRVRGFNLTASTHMITRAVRLHYQHTAIAPRGRHTHPGSSGETFPISLEFQTLGEFGRCFFMGKSRIVDLPQVHQSRAGIRSVLTEYAVKGPLSQVPKCCRQSDWSESLFLTTHTMFITVLLASLNSTCTFLVAHR